MAGFSFSLCDNQLGANCIVQSSNTIQWMCFQLELSFLSFFFSLDVFDSRNKSPNMASRREQNESQYNFICTSKAVGGCKCLRWISVAGQPARGSSKATKRREWRKLLCVYLLHNWKQFRQLIILRQWVRRCWTFNWREDGSCPY